MKISTLGLKYFTVLYGPYLSKYLMDSFQFFDRARPYIEAGALNDGFFKHGLKMPEKALNVLICYRKLKISKVKP